MKQNNNNDYYIYARIYTLYSSQYHLEYPSPVVEHPLKKPKPEFLRKGQLSEPKVASLASLTG